MLNRGATAEKRDTCGNVALHWAAGFGHRAIVQALLNNGADPNTVNDHLEAPLHWYLHNANPFLFCHLPYMKWCTYRAAAAGHADICAILLQAGAHSFMAAIEGDTPLHRAAAVDDCNTVRVLLQVRSCLVDIGLDSLIDFHPIFFTLSTAPMSTLKMMKAKLLSTMLFVKAMGLPQHFS